MKDLLVLMGSSIPEGSGTMPLYLQQLEAASIDSHVEPIDSSYGEFDIAAKLRSMRRIIPEHDAYRFIVITDAFDVQFFGTKDQVLCKIPRDGVLHGAEKNCHPPECRTLSIPDAGPWKYANGGLFVGTPENLLKWCDEIESHPLYRHDKVDQQLYNELLAEGSDLARIDWKTELFFCLYGGYDELDFAAGLPVNLRYATWPNFIHANGKWDACDLYARKERSLK